MAEIGPLDASLLLPGVRVRFVEAAIAECQGLREVGAAEVVIGIEGVRTRIDVMLDNVGGSQRGAAWGLLVESGVVQCIGTTSQEPASFTSLVGMRRRIEAFTKGPHSGSICWS